MLPFPDRRRGHIRDLGSGSHLSQQASSVYFTRRQVVCSWVPESVQRVWLHMPLIGVAQSLDELEARHLGPNR